MADDLLKWMLRRGDSEAIQTIYQRHKDALLTIARSLLWDHAGAEDCLHDVFMVFCARARQINVKGPIGAYLATCVANRAKEMLRRRQATSDRLEATLLESTSLRPADALVARDEVARIHACISSLPWEQGEVLTLHLYGMLRFRQIARHQGVNVATVQSRYRYALEKLRTLLQKEYEP